MSGFCLRSLLVSITVTVAAPIAIAVDPGLSLVDLFESAPWAPALSLAVSATAVGWSARLAFRGLDETRADSRIEEQLSAAAYGLLGNALIDAGLFVLACLVLVLDRSSGGLP